MPLRNREKPRPPTGNSDIIVKTGNLNELVATRDVALDYVREIRSGHSERLLKTCEIPQLDPQGVTDAQRNRYNSIQDASVTRISRLPLKAPS